ncbi:MAG: amino acid permease [Lentisphaerae bacterium]|nr:amino acid permease [Lentisphaerota bacterium]
MINGNSDAGIGEKKNVSGSAYLSPLGVIALSFGYAVGWGSFVMPGAMFLPKAGPAGTIIGLLIGTAAMIVLAFNYHKMISSVQGSGGAYGYVTKMFGYNHGFLVGWFLFLTYISVLLANATALVLLVRYLFGNSLQFGFHYTLVGFDVHFGEVLLCLGMIVFCGSVCLLSKRFAIRIHTFFAFMLIAGVLVCFIAALCGHRGGTAAMAPAFSTGAPAWLQILRIFAMAPWAFVGFEAVVQSSSEFRFPVKRTFSLLLTAILLSALVYILLALLPVLAFPEGFSNWKEYIDMLPRLKGIDAMPVFTAAQKALGPVGVAVIGGSMLSAQLTALFATYIALSRLLRAMSDDEMLPKWFGRCNAEGTPVNAILCVMGISLPVPFLGRTVIGWPVDLSNFGAAIAYGYTSAAVLALVRKDPSGGRAAEKAAGFFGLTMAVIFSLLMMVPNYLSGSSLSTESYLLLVLWCFVGFVLYRRDFIQDSHNRFGHAIVVWIAVLIVIFFSSLMWFRLAVCDSAENAFQDLVGKTVTREAARSSISHVNGDMLFKSMVELGILIASLSIILNLISILHRREDSLIVEKLKAEESANRSKSYFFSTISHDIRTPLNAIIGYSQMLKMGFKLEEDREQALNSIISSGKSLIRLINDAIDFAKLEDGQLVFERKPTDCAGLLRKFVDAFRRARQLPSVEIRYRAEGRMPTLLIDPKRVRQILFNLLDNAAKFTRQGFVEVRASFERAPEGGTGTLRLEVEDTGCGISEQDLKRITSPYVQVDAKQARHGGTGIGLSICLKMAAAMGGALSIASTFGKGSTFTVTINNVEISDASPVEDDEPPAIPNAVPADISRPEPAAGPTPETPPENAAPKRILIADDQKLNLMVLKTMLKKLGPFEVVMAKDGREALDILTSSDTPFDLVLTDMWMPVMDGEGLVHAIRADGKLAAMPVHVVTADTEMQGKYGEIGFNAILLKPVTVEKLREIIG